MAASPVPVVPLMLTGPQCQVSPLPGHPFPELPGSLPSGLMGSPHSATCPLRSNCLPVCLALLPEETHLCHRGTPTNCFRSIWGTDKRLNVWSTPGLRLSGQMGATVKHGQWPVHL